MPYVSVCVGCLPAVFIAFLEFGFRLEAPGIALLSGLAVGAVALFLLGLTGEHYLRYVPPSERMWWMWALLVGSCALALGPLAATIKARQLNRLYRKAVAADQSGGGNA